MKICARCGHENHGQDTFCGQCGMSLAASGQQPPTPPADAGPPPAAPWTPPEHVSSTVIVPPWVSETAPPAPVPAEPMAAPARSTNFKVIAVIAAIVTILIIAVASAVVFAGNDTKSSKSTVTTLPNRDAGDPTGGTTTTVAGNRTTTASTVAPTTTLPPTTTTVVGVTTTTIANIGVPADARNAFGVIGRLLQAEVAHDYGADRTLDLTSAAQNRTEAQFISGFVDYLDTFNGQHYTMDHETAYLASGPALQPGGYPFVTVLLAQEHDRNGAPSTRVYCYGYTVDPARNAVTGRTLKWPVKGSNAFGHDHLDGTLDPNTLPGEVVAQLQASGCSLDYVRQAIAAGLVASA